MTQLTTKLPTFTPRIYSSCRRPLKRPPLTSFRLQCPNISSPKCSSTPNFIPLITRSHRIEASTPRIRSLTPFPSQSLSQFSRCLSTSSSNPSAGHEASPGGPESLSQSAQSQTPDSQSPSQPSSSSSASGQTHQFQAETQKLLHIVTHSLYTDKEVFVRELISNASDALEKLRFLQATGQASSIIDPDLPLDISISCDPISHTITFSDRGVGMTKEEAVSHLGTIAKSGSLEFLDNQKIGKERGGGDGSIIGQFGVGFYSSFVVSSRVEVFTRHHDPLLGRLGYHWESDGKGTFTIRDCPNLPRGTSIVCHLKPDSTDFSTFSTLKAIVEKFSSFVSFPITLKKGIKGKAGMSQSASEVSSTSSEDKKDDKKNEEEEVVITNQEALWMKRNPTEEEHQQFYKYVSGQSWSHPLYKVAYQTDAPLSIKALLYIPEEAPNKLFSKGETTVGVALHSRRILVKKAADNLIPRWLSFIKGVIDCEDVPLNVSRENMQDTKLMDKISHSVVTRLLRFLDEESKRDPESYKKFYKQYSQYLKEGFLEDLQSGGKYKDMILRLLRFSSSGDLQTPAADGEKGVGSLKDGRNQITLEEYMKQCDDKQKNIYYFCASDRKTALSSPYLEPFTSRGIPVLLLLEEIDEFVAMHMGEYKGKQLVAIDSGEGEAMNDDLNNLSGHLNKKEDGSSKEEIVKLQKKEQDELAEFLRVSLGKRVSAIKFSERLVSSPAIVSGYLSPSLRRMMKATMKGADGSMDLSDLPSTLELNPSHRLISSLYHIKGRVPDVAKLVAEQLLDNACIAAGILDEPRSMLGRLNELLQVTSSYAYHHNIQTHEENSEEAGVKRENDERNANGNERTAEEEGVDGLNSGDYIDLEERENNIADLGDVFDEINKVPEMGDLGDIKELSKEGEAKEMEALQEEKKEEVMNSN